MPMLISGYGASWSRRNQYRYHAKWRVLRDQSSLARMLEFGAALPKLRERVEHDLGRTGHASRYIHPAVFAAFGNGGLTALRARAAPTRDASRAELALMELLSRLSH